MGTRVERMTDRELLDKIREDTHRSMCLLSSAAWKEAGDPTIRTLMLEAKGLIARVIGLCDERIKEDEKIS